MNNFRNSQTIYLAIWKNNKRSFFSNIYKFLLIGYHSPSFLFLSRSTLINNANNANSKAVLFYYYFECLEACKSVCKCKSIDLEYADDAVLFVGSNDEMKMLKNMTTTATRIKMLLLLFTLTLTYSYSYSSMLFSIFFQSVDLFGYCISLVVLLLTLK